MEAYRRRTEAMMYSLQNWIIKNLDNENVSDGLYGFIKDLSIELKRELTEIEENIILGGKA